MASSVKRLADSHDAAVAIVQNLNGVHTARRPELAKLVEEALETASKLESLLRDSIVEEAILATDRARSR